MKLIVRPFLGPPATRADFKEKMHLIHCSYQLEKPMVGSRTMTTTPQSLHRNRPMDSTTQLLPLDLLSTWPLPLFHLQFMEQMYKTICRARPKKAASWKRLNLISAIPEVPETIFQAPRHLRNRVLLERVVKLPTLQNRKTYPSHRRNMIRTEKVVRYSGKSFG